MAEVTVQELAESIGTPVTRLLTQMGEAGLKQKRADQAVSDDEKQKLLSFLKRAHGDSTDGPRKITLTRKVTSQIRAPGSGGRGKTVSVEVRKKRTYEKRDTSENIEISVVTDSVVTQRAEEDAKLEAARARQVDEKRLAAEAEQQKKTVAEEKVTQAKAALAKTETAPRRAASTPGGNSPSDAPKPTVGDRANSKKSISRKPKQLEDKDAAAHHRPAERPKGNKHQQMLELIGDNEEGGGGRRRRRKSKRRDHQFQQPTTPMLREVGIGESISVSDLAQQLSAKSTEVVKMLFKMGVVANPNMVLDQDTAILVVEEMGQKFFIVNENAMEDSLVAGEVYDQDLVTKAPVVTVMGHVDHGKTSLLDYIRDTRVAAGESGGITQHIGAYHVNTPNGMITFLDTPGHAAFTAMRARGARSTDVVILVVAADDGVMPQTEEAILHARAAGVPLVVAINKMDKEGADPERVTNELSQRNVISEEWGGDTQFVKVSAHTGLGIEELLNAILLQAEVLELKATHNAPAKGVVVESRLDKGRGAVSTVLVQNGTLKKGDIVLAGQSYGKVRALLDEKGKPVDSAGPAIPIQILGLDGTPEAGDDFIVVANEKKARDVASFRREKMRQNELAHQKSVKLENLFSDMTSGEVSMLNLLIKTDVQGSLEALKGSLLKLGTEEVKVNIIGGGVGAITESDANLAVTAKAVIFGFNVRASNQARDIIERSGIDLRYYSVIYDIIDDVRAALNGMLAPELREDIVGIAEVRDVFNSPKYGQIAGCLVIEGTVHRNKKIRVLRQDVVIYEGELESLRRYKDDVQEVRSGTECGIGVKNYTDVQPGDKIEVFDVREIARTID